MGQEQLDIVCVPVSYHCLPLFSHSPRAGDMIELTSLEFGDTEMTSESGPLKVERFVGILGAE